jgi:hypothetical protein
VNFWFGFFEISKCIKDAFQNAKTSPSAAKLTIIRWVLLLVDWSIVARILFCNIR